MKNLNDEWYIIIIKAYKFPRFFLNSVYSSVSTIKISTLTREPTITILIVWLTSMSKLVRSTIIILPGWGDNWDLRCTESSIVSSCNGTVNIGWSGMIRVSLGRILSYVLWVLLVVDDNNPTWTHSLIILLAHSPKWLSGNYSSTHVWWNDQEPISECQYCWR